jgi:hypothetical protein
MKGFSLTMSAQRFHPHPRPLSTRERGGSGISPVYVIGTEAYCQLASHRMSDRVMHSDSPLPPRRGVGGEGRS